MRDDLERSPAKPVIDEAVDLLAVRAGRSVENATFLLWQACSPRAGLRPEWATVGETLRKAVAAVLELHASTKKLGMLDVESNDIEIEAPSR